MIRAVLLALAAGVPLDGSGLAAQTGDTALASVAHLRGLDTLSGRTHDLDLRVGETGSFGHLDIKVETCRVPEVDPEGDAMALLRIHDRREAGPRFAGWMYASSPALSALDHPRYDVWVLSCSSR